jgi:hypothetical protein
MDIILGILSSLVASLIWMFFVFLYDPRGRNKILFLLEECENSTRLLLNSIDYNYYAVALSQVDQLIFLYLQINDRLKPINFSRKKRKLIQLLIFNMIRVLNIFKNLEIGYNEEEEFKARCNRFKKKYLYDLHTGTESEVNFMIISISILKGLCDTKCIHKSIVQSVEYFSKEKETQRKIMDNLIEINSFKGSSKLNYLMGNDALTHKKYQKIINRIWKEKK